MKTGAREFLFLGLGVFIGFCLELLVRVTLSAIWNAGFSYSTFQACTAWTITCVIWGAVAVLLAGLSKRKYDFDVMSYKDRPSIKKSLITIFIIVAVIVLKSFLWSGFKPVQEFGYFGLTEFIFQYIYYLFETALIVLLIAFGQKFGELAFKRKNVPFGGLLLAVTWGAFHIITQDVSVGIYAIIMAVIYGLVYILMSRNIRYSYIAIAALFIL